MDFLQTVFKGFDSKNVSNYIQDILSHLLYKKFNNLADVKEYIYSLYPLNVMDGDFIFAVHYIIIKNIQYRLPSIETNLVREEISKEKLYLEYYEKYFPRLNEFDDIEYPIIKKSLIDNIYVPISWRSRGRIVTNEIKTIKGFYNDYELIWDEEYTCARMWIFYKSNKKGEFLFGHAHNGCDLCNNIINCKIFRIGVEPEIMFKNDMFNKWNISEEHYYQKYIWPDKKIYNDIYSFNKRSLISKEEKRIIYPNVPLHQLCSCNFYPLISVSCFFDDTGKMQSRNNDNEEKWKIWYEEKIISDFPEYRFEAEYIELLRKVYKVYDIFFSKNDEIFNISFEYEIKQDIFNKINELKNLLMRNVN